MRNKASLIGSLAGRAMLREVCATPKPGLVDRSGSGSHDDMDITLFMESTASLIPYLCECAGAGINFTGRNPSDILSQLREIGMRGEAAMFEATGGVNTQKGLMFSLGLLCASAGNASVRSEKISATDLCGWAAHAVSGIVSRELDVLQCCESDKNEKVKRSSGERLFLEHGVSGIRGEAERGFPVALNRGLPALKSCMASGMSHNDSMITALLEMMTLAEDTNVIQRSGIEGLKLCRSMAEKALSLGGVTSREGRSCLLLMGQLFEEKRISPGGSADLLAVSEFLRMCEELI